MRIETYTEKPKEIKAIRFGNTMESIRSIKDLTGSEILFEVPTFGRAKLTLKGVKDKSGEDIVMNNGDYLVTTVRRDVFKVCDAEEFHEKWEPKKENK